MRSLDELEKEGITLGISSDENINEKILRRQINMNGTLNDYNTATLPLTLFSTPPLGLLALVQGKRKKVTMCWVNKKGSFIPFCDFPLAEKITDLTLPNQIRTMYDHLARTYLDDIDLIVGEVQHSSYDIRRITLAEWDESSLDSSNQMICSGDFAVEKNTHKPETPSSRWRNSVGEILHQKEIDYPRLYRTLWAFQRDLREATGELEESLTNYLPCFINISNILAMIYESAPKIKDVKTYPVSLNKSGRQARACLPNLEAIAFLNYTNTSRIVEQGFPVSIPFKVE